MSQKIKEHPVISLICIEVIMFFGMALLGFKITYNPNLITDWTAIEAVGTWVCGLIIPFAVIYVQKKVDDSERRTGKSNAATIDEVRKIKETQDGVPARKPSETITEQDVYDEICINVVISTEDIARKFGVNVKDIEKLLKTLYSQKRILALNGYGNIRKDVAGCRWKIR